jgi:hypothetical protein
MFNHMDHLGPHTFVAGDHHDRGDQWLSHFNREERHHLVEEDQKARNFVATLLFSAMAFGLVITGGALFFIIPT